MTFSRFIRLLMTFPLLAISGAASARPGEKHDRPATVLFVCQRGGAKSVIAASYFDRAARVAGIPIAGVAVASEEPYDRVPDVVVELLERDGFRLGEFAPRHVACGDLERAERVVVIDCELPPEFAERDAEEWKDVPKVGEDLEGAVDAIQRHVEALVEELRERR